MANGDFESEEGAADYFPESEFSGTIACGGAVMEIMFSARVGPDGKLVVAPLFVNKELYLALSSNRSEPGSESASFSLQGLSKDGVAFHSDDMQMIATNHNSEGFQITPQTGVASLTSQLDVGERKRGYALTFKFRGFKSFRNVPVMAKLGEVHVLGATKIDSKDQVSGSVSIVKSDAAQLEGWFAEAEGLLGFLHSGLEFAHGGRLQIPIVEEHTPDQVTASFYHGSGRPAHLPAINKLNQSAFIAALVARYESEEPFSEDIWQAVGWLNSDSLIDEVRFLTLMTALETVLKSLVPDASSTLIEKASFKPILKELREVLSGYELEDDEIDVLKANLGGINRAPLSKKLKALIAKYSLSSDMFDDEKLKLLNKQRVSIVHSGHRLPDEDLWSCILYARELIARIVFAELGYTGQFESYAEGWKQDTLN